MPILHLFAILATTTWIGNIPLAIRTRGPRDPS